MTANYTDLQAEIAQFLGRTDLSASIPLFVRMAEARMNRELRLKLMEREAWTTVKAGQGVIPLPDKRVPGDWNVFLEMRDLRLNGSILKNLDYMSLDRIPERREAGTPYAYSIRGRELVLIPTPNKDCELLLTYYAEVPQLGSKQPSNEILLRLPDLYLYGSLVASGGYTRTSAPLELWGTFYKAAGDAAMNSDEHGRFTANIARPPIRSV